MSAAYRKTCYKKISWYFTFPKNWSILGIRDEADNYQPRCHLLLSASPFHFYQTLPISLTITASHYQSRRHHALSETPPTRLISLANASDYQPHHKLALAASPPHYLSSLAWSVLPPLYLLRLVYSASQPSRCLLGLGTTTVSSHHPHHWSLPPRLVGLATSTASPYQPCLRRLPLFLTSCVTISK